MKASDETILVVGGGLAGTLVALELERRGLPFRIADVGRGAKASRIAAGLLNPLIGPRLSAPDFDWALVEPHYRELENRLGARDKNHQGFFHALKIVRPEQGLRISDSQSRTMEGSGWNARNALFQPGLGWRNTAPCRVWEIHGGAWLDIPLLIDSAHARFRQQGVLTEQWMRFEDMQETPQRVIWCEGSSVFDTQALVRNHPWKERPWQAVSGEVLTVRIPALELSAAWIAGYFILPLGNDLFRVGATHRADSADGQPSEEGRKQLESFISDLIEAPFVVVKHEAGVRPATRNYLPFVERNADHPHWFLFNGFAGRGASRIPSLLPHLMELIGI